MPLTTYAFLGDGGAGWAQIPYLAKILAENIKQYRQLKYMFEDAKEHHEYIRLINEGLENSLGLLKTLPIKDAGVLSRLRNFEQAYREIQGVYGSIPTGPEAPMFRLQDESVAEGLKMVQEARTYSQQQEENAQKILIQGRFASPKGAARMNTEVSAQILHTLNQILRINGQLLKLQSEQMAYANKEGKDSMNSYNKSKIDIKSRLGKFKGDFKLPRF